MTNNKENTQVAVKQQQNLANQHYDKTKFSMVEVFLNESGKTSITKLIGFGSSAVCIVMFVVMLIFYMTHVAESEVVLLFVDRIITFFGIAAGLMGIKSISSSFGNNNKIQMNNSDSGSQFQQEQRNRRFGTEENNEPA